MSRVSDGEKTTPLVQGRCCLKNEPQARQPSRKLPNNNMSTRGPLEGGSLLLNRGSGTKALPGKTYESSSWMERCLSDPFSPCSWHEGSGRDPSLGNGRTKKALSLGSNSFCASRKKGVIHDISFVMLNEASSKRSVSYGRKHLFSAVSST